MMETQPFTAQEDANAGAATGIAGRRLAGSGKVLAQDEELQLDQRYTGCGIEFLPQVRRAFR